ncbi:MAG: DNA methyltransferase [Clostridia bacterium]|nr:DNA methyltransferase [Clostridia bacterium]
MSYQEFLETKKIIVATSGFEAENIHQQLFPFQRDLVKWALRRGKAALFCDCGLGKTIMQLEWAKHVHNHTGGNVLILAPLAVARQTALEGEKIGLDVTICRSQDDVKPGVNITNYEMLHKFETGDFAVAVLDESSILKAYDGKTRTTIIESFANTPYRLACTATPAPNDFMELGNHSEFLGVMSRTEMLATFFVHDSGDTSKWRLKGHAENKYWEWVASWAAVMRKPSDLGYEDGDFTLPDLHIHEEVVRVDKPTEGRLFAIEALTLQDRQKSRRTSLTDRVKRCAELVNASDDPWITWCDLNAESDALTKAIPGAVEVKGSDGPEHKEKAMADFTAGKIRVLVTKPSIAGFGMNWQHCAKMAFVGLSDSYEAFYQAVRRCWRFGQKKPVNAYVIIGEQEGSVVANIKRKEADALRMQENLVKHTQEITKKNIHSAEKEVEQYKTATAKGDGWTLYLGDCVEVAREIPDNSIHYTIFSPPFSSLYTYSNSERDMGNCKNNDQFFTHFRFLVSELYRITMPGRLLSFHCMDIPAMKDRDGYIGLKDFPGDLLRMFEAAGFIYHAKAVIWKDPLVEATRTKALGLMHKQLVKDSSMCRQGLPDYLITVRKIGTNQDPITHPDGLTCFAGEDEPNAPKIERPNPDMEAFAKHQPYTGGPVYSHQVWRRYASPVWMDINQSNTLNRESAREHKDERHICPLQLDVIERALTLWSNEGDLAFSPFAGIGSEGYQALKMKRKFIGVELKQSYFEQARNNLERATASDTMTLFDFIGKDGETA